MNKEYIAQRRTALQQEHARQTQMKEQAEADMNRAANTMRQLEGGIRELNEMEGIIDQAAKKEFMEAQAKKTPARKRSKPPAKKK